MNECVSVSVCRCLRSGFPHIPLILCTTRTYFPALLWLYLLLDCYSYILFLYKRTEVVHGYISAKVEVERFIPFANPCDVFLPPGISLWCLHTKPRAPRPGQFCCFVVQKQGLIMSALQAALVFGVQQMLPAV